MIVIVSGHIGHTLQAYEIKDFRHCRLLGTLDGKPVRIIPVHRFPNAVRALPFEDVIFDRCKPTQEQQDYVNAHRKPTE
jgi:hypothetical protein